MKKNLLILLVIAFGGVLTVTLNTVLAQDNPPASAPVAPAVPANPNFHPPAGSPAVRSRNQVMLYRRAANYAKNAKMELQRSTDDFNGHRQSAIDACDKAMQELNAVAQAIDDAAKAAAAAQQPAGAPASPAPAATPNQ